MSPSNLIEGLLLMFGGFCIGVHITQTYPNWLWTYGRRKKIDITTHNDDETQYYKGKPKKQPPKAEKEKYGTNIFVICPSCRQKFLLAIVFTDQPFDLTKPKLTQCPVCYVEIATDALMRAQ